MAILNNDYVVKRPSDYVSKLGISYQGMEDFYSPDKYNDGLYLLEKELENIELTDEKLHVVAEDKKLSEVLPTVARKGEILPQDIKGNNVNKKILTDITITENGDLTVLGVRDVGLDFRGTRELSNIYAKRTDLKSLQTSSSKEIESLKAKDKHLEELITKNIEATKAYKEATDGYFQDLGTEVNRHENANNKLEELL